MPVSQLLVECKAGCTAALLRVEDEVNGLADKLCMICTPSLSPQFLSLPHCPSWCLTTWLSPFTILEYSLLTYAWLAPLPLSGLYSSGTFLVR